MRRTMFRLKFLSLSDHFRQHLSRLKWFRNIGRHYAAEVPILQDFALSAAQRNWNIWMSSSSSSSGAVRSRHRTTTEKSSNTPIGRR